MTVGAELWLTWQAFLVAEVAFRTDVIAVMLLADGIADVAVIAEVTTTQESGHGIDEVVVILVQVNVYNFHSRRCYFGRTRNNGVVVILANHLKINGILLLSTLYKKIVAKR